MDLKSYIKMELDGITRHVERSLKDLTAVDISWRPAAGCNSIGLILFHCARSEDHFVQGTLTKKPQIFEKWYKKMNKALEDGGAHYTLEQVNAFVVPDMKDILAYWAEVRKATLEYLDSLKASDFDKKVKLPWGEFNVAGIFSIIAGHTSGHLGEVAYLRGMFRGMDK
ncbi:MAG TPA: DinB family protein [Dehalococcoidales bacterium]|nr:DinB family protein [Dehalococcoidales bacterium]